MAPRRPEVAMPSVAFRTSRSTTASARSTWTSRSRNAFGGLSDFEIDLWECVVLPSLCVAMPSVAFRTSRTDRQVQRPSDRASAQEVAMPSVAFRTSRFEKEKQRVAYLVEVAMPSVAFRTSSSGGRAAQGPGRQGRNAFGGLSDFEFIVSRLNHLHRKKSQCLRWPFGLRGGADPVTATNLVCRNAFGGLSDFENEQGKHPRTRHLQEVAMPSVAFRTSSSRRRFATTRTSAISSQCLRWPFGLRAGDHQQAG